MTGENTPTAYDAGSDPVHGQGWNSAARWGGWSWRGPRDGEWFRTCSFCGCIHPEDLAPVLVACGPCTVCARTGWFDCFGAQQPGWYQGAKTRGELADFAPEDLARAEAMNPPHAYDPGGPYASWADRKYGYPHKFYVERLANREPQRLYVVGSRRARGDGEYSDHGMTWIPAADIPQGTAMAGYGDLSGYEVSLSTKPTLFAKFYTMHLFDPQLPPQVKAAIEAACGLAFTFEGGQISWRPTR